MQTVQDYRKRLGPPRIENADYPVSVPLTLPVNHVRTFDRLWTIVISLHCVTEAS